MFFRFVFAIVAALSLGIVGLFVWTIVKTLVARRELQNGGLKVADQFSIWSGHALSIWFGKRQMNILADLHKKFNVKTIGWLFGCRKAVSTVDLDLIKQIVLDDHETNRFLLNLPIRELEVDSLMLAKGDQWQRLRKIYAPALKSNKFKTPNVQLEIENSIDKLLEAINSKLDASSCDKIQLDIDDYAHRYSLDLIFNCFFKQNNLVDFHAEVDRMTHIIVSGYEAFQSSPLIHLCFIFPIIIPIIDWLTMRFHQQGKWRRSIMNFIKLQTRLNFEARKHLDELRRSGKEVADENNFSLRDGTKFSRNMIDHVIDQFYEGKLTKREYFHSTWFLMGAAEKTASDAIMHTIYQLAVHREIQEKLRKSITTEGEESEYLSWVINESLRILPPITISCSRTTSRDYRCDDGIVPSGTIVIISAHSIHQLEELWGPDADKFKPERFADAKNFHPLQFISFGAGARTCLGKEFVVHEMKRLICALLTRYQFHCEPVELKCDSPFLMMQLPREHILVQVSRCPPEC